VVLGREEIKRRLERTCSTTDAEGSSTERGVPAAVLIALVGHADDPRIILTRRQANLKNHAAEISFPGGRVEATDDSPASAALRETCEEIGLAPERVEVLGCLPARMTVSDFRVYPLVGWVKPPVELVIDPREVAEVLEAPLSFVLDETNHRREAVFPGGERQEIYVLEYEGQRIWGATAEMLVDLARALASSRVGEPSSA
jgi:8-oxo-dGTP pyrophosphatase MutT (NUDIX family)